MAKKEKKKKEPKRKPKYGLFSCVGYMYRLLWKYERRLAFVGIFTVPISLCLSALALFTPSAILSVLETSNRFSYIALVIVGLLLAKLLCDLINSILSIRISNAEYYVLRRMEYKDAPFVILDEPTAALDPIAEAAVYENFNELVKDKTAVFISHRLSSCRFCDHIAVFDHGQMIQHGSHDELLADERNKYYELWHAQAQYYTEQGAT